MISAYVSLANSSHVCQGKEMTGDGRNAGLLSVADNWFYEELVV